VLDRNYRVSRQISADDHVRLPGTYSDHALVPADRRDALFDQIRTAIRRTPVSASPRTTTCSSTWPVAAEQEGTTVTDKQEDPTAGADYQYDAAHEEVETNGEPPTASPPVDGTDGDYGYDLAHEIE
jgi:hypothetical protein